jgi:hypothetical protein
VLTIAYSYPVKKSGQDKKRLQVIEQRSKEPKDIEKLQLRSEEHTDIERLQGEADIERLQNRNFLGDGFFETDVSGDNFGINNVCQKCVNNNVGNDFGINNVCQKCVNNNVGNDFGINNVCQKCVNNKVFFKDMFHLEMMMFKKVLYYEINKLNYVNEEKMKEEINKLNYVNEKKMKEETNNLNYVNEEKMKEEINKLNYVNEENIRKVLYYEINKLNCVNEENIRKILYYEINKLNCVNEEMNVKINKYSDIETQIKLMNVKINNSFYKDSIAKLNKELCDIHQNLIINSDSTTDSLFKIGNSCLPTKYLFSFTNLVSTNNDNLNNTICTGKDKLVSETSSALFAKCKVNSKVGNEMINSDYYLPLYKIHDL